MKPTSEPPPLPEMPRGSVDLLVAGQGLAGTALALAAMRAGLSVHVADPSPQPGATASRVAAGLITPLTGKKINAGWRLDTFLPEAREFYTRECEMLGVHAFLEPGLVRWFASEEERAAFEKRAGEERIAKWVEGVVEEPVSGVDAPWGGFRMRGAARLDTPLWLDASRRYFKGEGAFTQLPVRDEDLVPSPDGVDWGGLHAEYVVFCQGIAAAGSRYFPGLPFRPACGEVLEIAWEGTGPRAVWNRGGKWLAPRDAGTALFGATYGFGEWEARVRPEGVRELREHLEGMLRLPHEIVGVRVGVRPIISQSRPLAGFHPAHPRLGMFNGLGSKGALTSPWAAGQIVAALVQGDPLDAELDLTHFPRWSAS